MTRTGEKVFVTGGAGFMGSSLVRVLVREATNLSGFSNVPSMYKLRLCLVYALLPWPASSIFVPVDS